MVQNAKIHVQVLAKRSLKARTELGALIASKAPTSSLVLAQPSLKASCDAVVKAGADLTTAITAEQGAKTAYAAARSAVLAKTRAFDAVHDVAVAQTEQYATTPEEVQNVGWTVAVPTKYLFASPLNVLVSFDVLKSAIVIEVKQPVGMRACVVEISTDPAVPTSWQRLDGDGVRRVLTGYPPGMYWIRVANIRAHAKSAYTEPVPVTVK